MNQISIFKLNWLVFFLLGCASASQICWNGRFKEARGNSTNKDHESKGRSICCWSRACKYSNFWTSKKWNCMLDTSQLLNKSSFSWSVFHPRLSCLDSIILCRVNWTICYFRKLKSHDIMGASLRKFLVYFHVDAVKPMLLLVMHVHHRCS